MPVATAAAVKLEKTADTARLVKVVVAAMLAKVVGAAAVVWAAAVVMHPTHYSDH